jgi:hypothetical protein
MLLLLMFFVDSISDSFVCIWISSLFCCLFERESLRGAKFFFENHTCSRMKLYARYMARVKQDGIQISVWQLSFLNSSIAISWPSQSNAHRSWQGRIKIGLIMILVMLYSIPVPFDIKTYIKIYCSWTGISFIHLNWFERFVPQKWNSTKDGIYIIVVAQQISKYNEIIPKWPFLWIFIGR